MRLQRGDVYRANAGAVSCGGGTSGGSGSSGAGTPHISETGVVMVTATGGAIVNSVSIAVTVP
jgi:hypothetical protein